MSSFCSNLQGGCGRPFFLFDSVQICPELFILGRFFSSYFCGISAFKIGRFCRLTLSIFCLFSFMKRVQYRTRKICRASPRCKCQVQIQFFSGVIQRIMSELNFILSRMWTKSGFKYLKFEVGKKWTRFGLFLRSNLKEKNYSWDRNTACFCGQLC